MSTPSCASSSSPPSASSAGTAGLPPCRHLRVNASDPALVKHLLDEQSAMFVLECGYTEDVSLSNLKLGLGVVSVLLTLLAQFYPLPFPANAGLLKWCVGVFFAIQALTQLMHMFVERDCILLTNKRTGDSSGGGKGKGKGKKGGKSHSTASPSSASSSADGLNLPPGAVSLHATLPRYETNYQLTLASRPDPTLLGDIRSALSSASSPDVRVSASIDITSVFDSNGVLLLELLHEQLRALMQQYARAAGKKRE